MNHLYHTLSPLILLTAFLVSLLAFLAPTPIFADRVSLLSVSLKSSSTSNVKRFIPEAALDPRYPDRQRMVKRAKKVNAASASSTKELDFVYGPLGESLYTSTRMTLSDRSEVGCDLHRRLLLNQFWRFTLHLSNLHSYLRRPLHRQHYPPLNSRRHLTRPIPSRSRVTLRLPPSPRNPIPRYRILFNLDARK